MQGWWWPGRQVVVVLPLAVLAVAWWAAVWAPARVALGAGLVLGAATYLWLLVEGLAGRLTLVVDFETTTAPVVRALRPLLPDLRLQPSGTTLLLVALDRRPRRARHRWLAQRRPRRATRTPELSPVPTRSSQRN